MKPTFSGWSVMRVGTSTGRMPASSARSVTRADRLADRTDANVASASTRVPPAVASEATVAQSVIGGSVRVKSRIGARRSGPSW